CSADLDEERRGEKRRGEDRYLTHNVIIVSQVASMGQFRRGVTHIPYVCLGALSNGGRREVIVTLRLGPVFTEREGERGGGGGENERGREGEREGDESRGGWPCTSV